MDIRCIMNWPLILVFDNWCVGSAKFFTKVETVARVIFKLAYGPGCQTKVAEFISIYRISIGRISLMLVINKFSNIIATKTNTVYFLVFGQWLNTPLETFAFWPKCTVDYWSVSNFSSGIEGKHKRHSSYWYSINGHLSGT